MSAREVCSFLGFCLLLYCVFFAAATLSLLQHGEWHFVHHDEPHFENSKQHISSFFVELAKENLAHPAVLVRCAPTLLLVIVVSVVNVLFMEPVFFLVKTIFAIASQP